MGELQNARPLTIPVKPGSAELSIKRSTFLARVHPFDDATRAKPLVQELRAEHFKARHVAWAFVIGSLGKLALRYSDDGEPSGTAGRPILGLIQKRNHTNTFVTVVRYYGGVKLGSGGLTRAYSGAAKHALEATTWEPLLSTIGFRLTVGYELWPIVEPILHEESVTGLETLFTDDITVTGRVVDTAFSPFEQRLTNVCHGRISINTLGE